MEQPRLNWIANFIWSIADDVQGDKPLPKNLGDKKAAVADPLRGLFTATIAGKPVVVKYEPDPELRDTEQLALLEDGGIVALLHREVLPRAPDAWYVPDSVKIGYETSFTGYFYQFKPLRKLDEIQADMLALERETEGLLTEIIGGNN